VSSLLQQLGAGLLDLVFAPACLGCRGPISTRAADRRVCPACWSRLRPPPLPRCERCWHPAPPRPPGVPPPACPLCAELPPSLRAVRSAYLHQEPLRQLVHALKYGGWWSLAAPLAARMAALPLPLEVEEEARLVIPVPAAPARRRERGYNQAELLAAELARIRGWSLAPHLLQRARADGSQTALHPSERRANVAGAFRVSAAGAADLAGEHVVLVDDVWTTGATALACGGTLLASGARAFSVITLARALPELDR
jgi:ComF family protein